MPIKPYFSITISPPPPPTTKRHCPLLTFYNYSPRPKFILTPNPLQASINIDNKYQAIQSFGQPQKL